MAQDTREEAFVAHLHLHLEPGERATTAMSIVRRDSPDAFYESHAVDRPDIGGGFTRDLLVGFILDLAGEQARQGVDYVELRVSPYRFVMGGMSWAEFFAGCEQAVRLVEQVTLRLIFLANRSHPTHFVDELSSQLGNAPICFVGIDVAGDERIYGTNRGIERLYLAGRSLGFGVTAHAGEFGDVANIWSAVDTLGAQRVGHALAAVGDRALLRRMVGDGIVVECSVTSNLATGAVRSVAVHPVRTMVEAGVSICFNTDVPLWSRATLSDEFSVVGSLVGEEVLNHSLNTAWVSRFAGRQSVTRDGRDRRP